MVLVTVWVLGLSHARMTPFGAGHEHATAVESGHLSYVRNLLAGKGLPTTAVTPEAIQPPTYYIMATAYSKIIGLRSAGHDPSLDIKLRSVGVLFGVLTVFGIFKIVFQLSDDQPLSVLAAGCIGLSPMFVSVAASIGNEMAGICCSTLAMVNLTRPPGTMKSLALAGFWTGLAFATHSMAVVLFVPWTALLALKNTDRKYVASGLVIALLLALPMLIHNLSVYGTAVPLPTNGSTFDLNVFVVESLKSAIGVFGSRTIYLSNFFYAPYLLLTVGACAVGVFSVTSPKRRRAKAAISCALAAFVVYILFNLKSPDPQASHLLVAAGPLGMICAYGWRRIFPNEKVFQVCAALLLLAFLGLDIYVLQLLPARFAAVAAVGSYLS